MTIKDYLDTISEVNQREKVSDLLNWVTNQFPELELLIKWKQPMFIHKKTFIIAFSHSKNHMSVAPEKIILDQFISRINEQYTNTKMLFYIKWNQAIDYDLIRDIIIESVRYKQDYDKFWL